VRARSRRTVRLVRRCIAFASLRIERLEDRHLLALTPTLLADLNLTYPDAGVAELVDIGGTTYFTANDQTHGLELWKTDGTEAGTMMVKDVNSGSTGSSPHELTDFNGTLFFVADDGATGSELWMSDGTAAGTVQVCDVYPLFQGSSPINLTVVGATLFFAANNGSTLRLGTMGQRRNRSGNPTAQVHQLLG